MSYIDDSLGQNETVLYRAHFPWFYHTGAWVLLIVLAAAALISFTKEHSLLAALLALAGLSAFLVILLPVWTTRIGVTNRRLVYQRGLLWRATHELQLRAL